MASKHDDNQMGSRWKTPADIERDMGMLSGPDGAEKDEIEPSDPEELYPAANIDLIEKSLYRNREKHRDERLLFKPVPSHHSDFNLELERKRLEDVKRVEARKTGNVQRNAVLSQFNSCLPKIDNSVPVVSDSIAFPPLLEK